MLRNIARSQTRILHASRRSFVSTVLLTRSWEHESVAVLRTEAKNRGLSSKGNKATLITRLQNHDSSQHKTLDTPPVVLPKVQQVQQIRFASTSTEVPGIPSSSEPTEIPPSYPRMFLDVKIPSTDTPIPEPEVQIPFLPDLWDSSKVNAESAPVDPLDVSVPSLIVVAGDASRISGTSHKLDTLAAPVSSEQSPSQVSRSDTSIFQDVAEDMFLPRSFKPPAGLSLAEIPSDMIKVTGTSTSQQIDHSRNLDREEKNGVWALLGLLVGSWLAAGYFKSPSAFAEKAEEHATVEKDSKHSH